MAVNLTEGAITSMCSDDFASDELQPVLQVIELKLLQTQLSKSSKRYRVVVSDGFLYQHGMLATQRNDLVDSGKLQKGSIVRLTQFACNYVADRMIVIIVELDIIMDKCDLIGEPKAAPRIAAARAKSANSANAGGMTATPSPVGTSPDHPKVNPPASNVYSSSSDPARYGPSNAPAAYPKVEPGASLPRSTTHGGGLDGDRNTGFRNPHQIEASRPMPNSDDRSPQPMYQQPSPMYTGPIGRNEAPSGVFLPSWFFFIVVSFILGYSWVRFFGA